MDTILLALTPEFEMLRDELGYDEYEDFDAYDIMFQQGYDRQLIEVADGETFEVPEGYRATLEGDELTFTYRLQPGIARNMNACFLMKKMGIIPAEASGGDS